MGPSSEIRSECCMPVWLIILISLLAVAGIAVTIFFCCRKSTEERIAELTQKLADRSLTPQKRVKIMTELLKLQAKLAKVRPQNLGPVNGLSSDGKPPSGKIFPE